MPSEEYSCKLGHTHGTKMERDLCAGLDSAYSVARTAADMLAEGSETFRERNAVYGDNYQMVGPIMAILFPNGVPAVLLGKAQFHLVELIVVKLSRFAVSKLTHRDSARDIMVYGAMIESVIAKTER